MPSPSPSPSQSPDETSSTALPQYTRLSHERLRPGRRGLNRMNEILAGILSRLTQGTPSADMDTDEVNTTSIPALIRHSAPLNRTGLFLDLSLDMDLEAGTPVSFQETQSLNRPDQAEVEPTGFLSESGWDEEYLDTGADHHEEEASGDDNSAEFDDSDSFEADSSELNLASEYDLYRGLQHPRDSTLDNGSNYYNSFINYTREHGYGSFSMESYDSMRSSFPQSIHVPQRLLLSLARQNTTNQNTLVSVRSPSGERGSNNGFPLRRQNARRGKPGASAQKLSLMAESLSKDFSGAFAAIRRVSPYAGKLPLFKSHICCIQPDFQGKASEYIEYRSSLKCKMRRFLQLRRESRLWSHRSGGEESSNSHSSKLKRKKIDSDGTTLKRQRVTRSRNDSPSSKIYVDLKLGEHINVAELSPQEKYSILDGLPCSYLKDGSAFAVKIVNAWAAKSEADSMNLTFSQVNLEEKILHGCFDLRKNGELSGGIYDITSFLGYLCGGSRSRYTINNANSVIQSKFSLLNDLFMTMIVDLGIINPKILQTLSGALQIPFSGELIDFRKNDLQFLKERNAKPSIRTRGILSRIENERAKLQLNEWFNIKPFSDFSVAFFMNYLSYTEQKLKNFRLLAPSDQEAHVEFAERMKENIYYLSRNFECVQKAKVPMIESKLRQFNKEIRQRRRHEPRSHLRKPTFLKDWESKVCEKLCDHITCGDTCLLNIQLNYMLFTVTVDISAEIDKVFGRFLGLVSRDSERKSLEKKYSSLAKQTLTLEAKDALFVCSLNRKTGSLEMHNTRAYLDYKYSSASQSNDGPYGTGGSSLDDYFGESLFSARSSPYSEDPYLMATSTIIRGEKRRGAAGSFSHGGGSANFDFV